MDDQGASASAAEPSRASLRILLSRPRLRVQAGSQRESTVGAVQSDRLQPLHHNRELTALARERLAPLQVVHDLTDLGPRGADQVGELSVRRRDTEHDAAMVLYAELARQFDQGDRHALQQGEADETGIAGEDAAETACRRLGDTRIGFVVDAQGDPYVALQGQPPDSAIFQRYPFEVMTNLRRHLG